MDVMTEISKVQSALAALGLSIDPKGGKDSHFQTYLRNLFNSQLQTNFPVGHVERELRRMWALIGQLRELQRLRPGVFKKCVGNLNKNTSEKNFWGYRFEVHIAQQLLHGGIEFTYQERPDFSVQHQGTEIYIECGSRRPDKPIDSASLVRQTLFSPTGTISKKAAMPYMNLQTALFLDVTNLIFNATVNNAQLDMIDLEQETAAIVNQTNCGAIALVVFGQNNQTETVGCLTTPICHDNIDRNLRDLLTFLYPRVEQRVLNMSVFRDT